MRRFILLAAVAGAACFASSAQAEGAYVGVEGGLYVQNRLSYDFIGLSDFFSTKYSKGYDVAGKLGYDFEGIRIEAEISYKRAATHQFGFQIGNQALLVERGSAVTGNVNTLSGMLNGYWDITQGRFRPYIGAGAGIARVSSDQVGYSGYGDSGIFLNQHDTAFAFQLMAGVRARITQKLSASLGYKYFDVEKVRLSVFNTTAKTSLHASSVVAGLSYTFGHSVVDTPPPPRPPEVVPMPAEAALAEAAVDAPPPPPAVPTSLTIVFVTGSANLAEDTKVSLDQIAIAYKQSGHASVMLTGADNAPAEYNEKLAFRRATATKTYLVSRGVPAPAISIQNFDGPSAGGKRASSASTIAPTVNISYGPGSGR